MQTKKRRTLERIEVIAAMTVLALMLAYSLGATPTGFATASGGGTQNSGEQQKGNPNYGVLKGYLSFVIKDSNNAVIDTEAPGTAQTVYFVAQGENINWTASITCNTEIKGKLKSVDADDAGGTCTSVDYETPTAYSCSATKTDATSTTIYKTSTSIAASNLGCFAAKLPTGNYDIYT